MPELPEVERARRLSEERIDGRLIRDVHSVEDDKVFDRSPAAIRKQIRGRRIDEVGRTGKYLWLKLAEQERDSGESPRVIVVHLGMSGSISCPGAEKLKLGSERYQDESEQWPPKHTKLRLVFEGGEEWAFANRRRFGRVFFVSSVLTDRPLRELGPDAWLALPTSKRLGSLVSTSRRAVKSILLDQSVISGIGNWLADDILLRAGIDPRRPGRSLTDPEFKKLRSAIRFVLKTAIDANASEAKFPSSWLFHQRWSAPEGDEFLRGDPVLRTRIGGRTTLIVPARQS